MNAHRARAGSPTEQVNPIPPQTARTSGPQAPGPTTPVEIRGPGWAATLRGTVQKFKADRCTMTAGSLAYSWFLALFPALIALLGVASLVNFGKGHLQTLVTGLGKFLPNSAAQVLTNAVTSATKHAGHGSVVVIIIAVLLALWSASAGMVALQTAMNLTYDVPTDRKFIGKRLCALELMLGTLILGGIAAILIVFGAPLGTAIQHHLSFSSTAFTIAWTVVRWLIAVVFVSLLFSLFYFLGPNRQSPRWQWVSPGGVVGTLTFLAASVGFSFYVAQFGHSSYSKTYGALAGVVLLMLWFYLTALAILFGAELNAQVERQGAAKAGDPDAQASTAQASTA